MECEGRLFKDSSMSQTASQTFQYVFSGFVWLVITDSTDDVMVLWEATSDFCLPLPRAARLAGNTLLHAFSQGREIEPSQVPRAGGIQTVEVSYCQALGLSVQSNLSHLIQL